MQLDLIVAILQVFLEKAKVILDNVKHFLKQKTENKINKIQDVVL